MEQVIRTVLQAKGIQAPEHDYSILAALYDSIQTLKGDLTETLAGDLDIALCHDLRGGKSHES